MSCREKAAGTEGWKTCPLRLAVSGRYWLPVKGNRANINYFPGCQTLLFRFTAFVYNSLEFCVRKTFMNGICQKPEKIWKMQYVLMRRHAVI